MILRRKTVSIMMTVSMMSLFATPCTSAKMTSELSEERIVGAGGQPDGSCLMNVRMMS